MKLVIATCTAVLLLGTAFASADRKPTDREREGIARALDGQACDTQPAGTCRTRIRISTKNERWAGVYLRPTRGNEATVQPADGSLKRKNHRWRLHQLGNGGGCGLPSAVMKDLRLACF